VLDVNAPSGQDYIEAMQIAGEFACAGRAEVVAKVLEILRTRQAGQTLIKMDAVHNHHNFALTVRAMPSEVLAAKLLGLSSDTIASMSAS
jgi:RNA-splicing ligase RtcB